MCICRVYQRNLLGFKVTSSYITTINNLLLNLWNFTKIVKKYSDTSPWPHLFLGELSSCPHGTIEGRLPLSPPLSTEVCYHHSYPRMHIMYKGTFLHSHLLLWSKSYSTSVWQVILTPAVLLSLKALGHCSARPTGLALPQRADSMAGADLWIFICHICGSCQPNGIFLRLWRSFHPEGQLHSITHDLSYC